MPSFELGGGSYNLVAIGLLLFILVYVLIKLLSHRQH